MAASGCRSAWSPKSLSRPAAGDQANPPPQVRYRPKERRYERSSARRPLRRPGRRVAAIRAYVMRGDSIWGVLRDENDLPTVVKMRLDRPWDDGSGTAERGRRRFHRFALILPGENLDTHSYVVFRSRRYWVSMF